MDKRLETEQNIWIATVRPDGRPHLVPIWFVWVNERAYICTETKSVKVHNLTANPRISFALEDGNKPLIGEGEARLIDPPYPAEVAAAFQSKFEWDISAEKTSQTLIEITPRKWLSWSTSG